MNKYFLSILLFLLLAGETTAQRVGGIYRIHVGLKDGLNIWIVDGATVRRDLYPEFLYGGNPQRYFFVPRHEIWIDNAITSEEFGYTVAHELKEFDLMRRQGLSYEKAHNSALEVERIMRRADDSSSHAHEQELPRVSPTDCDGVKEIAELPDSIFLHNVYRVPLGKRGGLSVWVVDGAVVRRDIYPDFGLSANDFACHFIPPKEIWIDGQISCEETEFSIATELFERELMAKGKSYDDSYEQAISAIGASRKRAADSARYKPSLLIPKVLDRDEGTGDEK
jgi:hypothetical protein